MSNWFKKETWWPKRRLKEGLNVKIIELSERLKTAKDDEADIIRSQLDKLVDLKEKLKKPKIPKEIWVEILKVLGMGAALCAVIKYDKDGHVLPNRLDKWIPGPRL